MTSRWTAAEDAVLRAGYGQPGGAVKVAEQLGRNARSVGNRAQLLGIARRCWSTDEDRRLGNLWGEKTMKQLGKLFGRTSMGVYLRAKKIGLPIGLPEGCWYLWTAAKRTGVTVPTLRRICERAEVKIRRAMARPSGRCRYPRHVVDAFEASEAVKAWVATETVNGAARRRRMGVLTLVKRLAVLDGVPKKPRKGQWRIPSEAIDRAIGRAA